MIAPPADPITTPTEKSLAELASASGRAELRERYAAVRAWSVELCAPLAPEDMVVQSMPDASPAKWHLAHTTWFFEVMLLHPARPASPWFDERFNFLFNSYYHTVGKQFTRAHRGLVTRPTVAEVYAYRREVDAQVEDFLATASSEELARWQAVLEIGLHHEQQHQELLITDLKHALAQNPLDPVYRPRPPAAVATVAATAPPLTWHAQAGGLYPVGHDGNGFAFDNEGPRHQTYLHNVVLASRLVTCGEYQEFIADGGYRRPKLWLSEGWSTVESEGWQAPLYWQEEDGRWWHFTLAGRQPVEAAEPVCHVSLFEADAYARWAGARLPTEFEWEVVAAAQPISGHFVEDGIGHPQPAPEALPGVPVQLYGDVWEWTSSSYAPYPGYRPPSGALGEYNGKFMCNQYVLRGGSCATPRSHIRATYRNFFPTSARWQFTGIRLAKDGPR